MRDKYIALIEEHEAILQKCNRVFGYAGLGKVLLALSLICFVYLMDKRAFPPELVAVSAADLMGLVTLWVIQNEIGRKIDFSKGIISVCQRQIDRITGAWKDFADTGAEFADPDHPYASDLDVTGDNSLFQFLNTTKTWHGRQAFAHDLLNADYDAAELTQRQEAIAELSRDFVFSCESQYYLSQAGADNYSAKITQNLQDLPSFLANSVLRLFLTYGPVLSLVFMAAVIITQRQRLYFVAPIIIFVQIIIWAAGIPATRKFLGPAFNLPNRLSPYDGIVKIFTGRGFASAKLNSIRERLNTATPAIKDLNRIESRISVKNNGIVYFLLNVFLLWDYRCVFLLDDWKKKYADMAEGWFLAVGEFESLLCFSHLPNVCDNTCLPAPAGERGIIAGENIGHPLLPNDSRVNNDISLKDAIFIISGSNMSGKTTLLRTVGVNLVLAGAGGFVCAKKMTFSPMKIKTSMRLADDLSGGVSTFYAELRRIGGIIEFAQKDPGMIFLIDEIFKGTNSEDRLTGAATVLTKLDALGAIGLVSTHDLELCNLADAGGRFVNFNFTEHYQGEEILFDYKIRPGKSKTTNARYLMQMVGILEK